MKVTLDTNVLVSGTFWTGDSFRLLEMVDKKLVKNITSRDIIGEYYETIESDEIIDKVKNKNLIISKIIDNVIKNSVFVDTTNRLNVIKEDPDDNKILECAKAGKADYIVSNDKHLLKLGKFENIIIMAPNQFLDKGLRKNYK